MIKKLSLPLLTVVLTLWFGACAFAADVQKMSITLDGKYLDSPAKVIDGNLLLPLRDVSETAGFKLDWSGQEQRVTIIKPRKVITFKIGDTKLTFNDHETYLLDFPLVINGRTYVSMRFMTDYLGLQVLWDKGTDQVILEKTTENQLEITTKKIIYKARNFTVNIQYPVLQGLADAIIEEKINSIFADKAKKSEQEGIKNRAELTDDDLARNAQIETYFDYTVKYNQQGMLSIVFADYQFSGGAHGSTVQSSNTFNLVTGIEYRLKDLFTNTADYISPINSEIKKQMDQRGITPGLLVPLNSVKEDQNFYLANSAIVIYFQQNEYASYSMGILEFPIETAQIPPIIREVS